MPNDVRFTECMCLTIVFIMFVIIFKIYYILESTLRLLRSAETL